MPIWYRKSTGSEDRARAATPHRAPGLLPFPKRHYLLTKIGRMIVLFLAFIFLSYLLPGDSFGKLVGQPLGFTLFGLREKQV